MEDLKVNSIVYAAVAYKFFEPVILKFAGKKEKHCEVMETRVRTVENKLAILETQNENFNKKLDGIDKKLDELITRKGGK